MPTNTSRQKLSLFLLPPNKIYRGAAGADIVLFIYVNIKRMTKGQSGLDSGKYRTIFNSLFYRSIRNQDLKTKMIQYKTSS